MMEERSVIPAYIVRGSLLMISLVALPACPLPIHVGDLPLDGSSGGSAEGGESVDAGEAPTGGAGPGVCGDGVVGEDEACDDGNADADDGCDVMCARTGNVAWTFTPDATQLASDVAVDADGRIIVVGPGVLFALGPDGEVLWQRTIVDADAYLQVVVDAARRIYVSSEVGVVHGFDPDGEELWREGEALPEGGQGIVAIAVSDDTLYSLLQVGGTGEESRIFLRTHDRESGEVLTSVGTSIGVPIVGEDLAVSGEHVIAVGFGSLDDEPPLEVQAVVAVFDLAGAPISLDFANSVGESWRAVAATSDGGFVLAGSGPVVTVRRLDADLQVLWNHTDEGFFGSWVNDIAVGPGDVVAMAGHGKLEHQGGFVRRFSAPGEPAWTSAFESQQQDGFAQAHALAFGPDFLVGLGTTDESGWIRRFALE
jgi:cysteine-rich repeat protein